MCRAGGRRCPGNVLKTRNASIRKAATYQAQKDGLSIQEWKEQNPEKLAAIQEKFSAKYQDVEGTEVANTQDSNVSPISTTQQGQNETPDQHAERLGFMSDKGVREDRIYNVFDSTYFTLHEFKESKQDYHRDFDKHIEEYGDTKSAHDTIAEYTSELYTSVNNYFNKGMKPEFDEYEKNTDPKYRESFSSQEAFDEHVKCLDHLTQNKWDHNKTLYRGQELRHDSGILKGFLSNPDKLRKMPEEESNQALADATLKAFETGKTIEFSAYSSTSESPRVAASWKSHSRAAVVYEIKSTRGAPIEEYTSHHRESEVLLPRNSRFKVVRSYQATDSYEYNQGTFTEKRSDYAPTIVVQLVEVDEEGNELASTSPAEYGQNNSVDNSQEKAA